MTSPTRLASNPRSHRLAQLLLLVGGIVALTCFLFATWTGRLGIGIMLITAVVVGNLAWQETRRQRVADHEDRMAEHERRHTEMTYEREMAEAVISMMKTSNVALGHTLLTLRSEAAWRQVELANVQRLLSALRGDNAALTIERDALREKVASLEVEPVEEQSAEIFALPRRVLRHQRKIWGDEQVWGTDSMPSVASLVADDVARPAATPLYRKQA